VITLSEEKVAAVFTHAEALAAAERAFRALDAGKVEMPPRGEVRIPSHSGTQLTMPCYIHDELGEALTVKIVSVFENNGTRGLPVIQAFLQLQDPETGVLLALMEAEHLTAMRTAAASVLSTKLFANPSPKSILVVGLGRQARTHILAMADAFPGLRIHVCDKKPARAIEFCAKFAEFVKSPLIPVERPSDCLAEVSVVCLATNSREPVLLGDEVRPGLHVTAIGSFRPDMAEFDCNLIVRARVYVDQLGAAQKGAGELIQAASHEVWSWNDIAGELGGVLNSKVRGRTSSDQITVFKSVGLAVQDATAAASVYRIVSA